MIKHAVDDFRKSNGSFQVIWENWITERCAGHSKAMAFNHGIYHADSMWLNGLNEAVCCSHIWLGKEDMIRYMVFELLGKSNGHRTILLNSCRMGGQDYIADGMIYLTIRGI